MDRGVKTMACDCDSTTCGWRENGGTCDNCKIKAMIEGCNCPLQMKKDVFNKWLLKQILEKPVEECECGCNGKK